MVSRLFSFRDLRLLVVTTCLMLFTAAAHATAPNAPTALGGFIYDTATVYFSFDDNSTNETGWDILVNGSTHYQVLSGATNTNATTAGTGNVIIGLGLSSGGTITVQIAAYTDNLLPANISAYTNAITITSADFNTPAIALITNVNETTVRLANVDNASGEAGYLFEYRVPPAAFASGGNTGPNASNVNFPGLAPGTSYEFRIRGFKGTAASPTAYTAYSNTYPISTPFTAPTGFTATVQNDSTVLFTWADNSSAETGYEIQYSIASANNFKKLGTTGANTTTTTLGGFGPGQSSLSPGQSYDFKVQAIYNSGTVISSSAFSSVVTTSTKDGFTSATYKQIPYNQAFTYQAVVTTLATRNSWSITGLPTGLSFNTTTGQITGTPTVTGVFNCPMTAAFVGGASASTTLTLRVVLPPLAATSIPAQTAAIGGNVSVPLSDKFTDPDTTSAAQLVTNQGTMNFILYDTTTTTQNATPLTVANFLSYVRNFGVSDTTNKFDGAVFHRSIPGFIVQGGAFKVQSAPNNFSSITTSASPTNEPVNSNTRGTVAMAKLGGDPNSATDQFFVNLADNSSILDGQNGGFTAFARVAGNGMSVADAIAALPTVDSLVNLAGVANTSLTDWPLTSTSTVMDTTKMVSITSATKNVPVLTYAITGNTNTSAVTASINTTVDSNTGISSSSVQINGVAGGQSNVTVTATDLDGNTVSQTFAVTVNQAPVITSTAPSAVGIVGTAYNFNYTATGIPAPTFSVTSGALPDGLTLSSAGAITGTCTAAGTFAGVVTATNSSGTNTQGFSITVNQVPAFTNGPPTTTAVLGTAYSFTCTASGAPAPTFTVSAGALPTGLTLSSAGAITGTPTAIGTFSGTVKATNTVGNVTQNFSITVNQVPAFTNGPPPTTGTIGTAYSFTYTASGTPTPTFSVTAGGLPTGLTLSSAGAITGTPTATGVFTGTVTASNTAGTTTQNFSITVNQVPAFTNGPPTTTAVLSAAYSFTCTASGYPAPTFTVSAGALPTGLTLSSAGAITGTPTAIGTFSGTVKATNTVGNVTQNFSITVNQVPAFTNGPPPTTGTIGTAYSFTYTASGSPAPTFTVTAGGLPTGLSLSTAGAITGTPTTAGTFSGTVTASNTAGTTTQNFSISVPKLSATVTLNSGSLAQTYDGTAKVATATTNPSGKTVTFTYNGFSTLPINAGSYTVVGTIVDTNYAGTSSPGTLVIAQATATIALSNTTQSYDGTAKSVTATTNPAGLSVSITYNGSSTAPSGFGTYTVAASITDPNYTGTQSGSLTIQGQTSSSWKAQHFTAGQVSAGLSADNADPDGDTLPNLAEYALGTDPLVRNTPPQPTYDVNGLTLIFTRPKALPNVTYTAQSTDSLGTWNAVTLEVITDGPMQTIRARDPLTSGNTSRRFMHLIFGAQ